MHYYKGIINTSKDFSSPREKEESINRITWNGTGTFATINEDQTGTWSKDLAFTFQVTK